MAGIEKSKRRQQHAEKGRKATANTEQFDVRHVAQVVLFVDLSETQALLHLLSILLLLVVGVVSVLDGGRWR